MDLSLSEDELLLQSSVQAFVRKAASTEVLTSLQDNEPGHRTEWTRPMADAGWTGILVPETLGGAGATALEAALVCEELGRGPLPGPFLASSVVSALLLRAAPATESRESVLREIAAGTDRSSSASIDTRARRVGREVPAARPWVRPGNRFWRR